ncbi:NADPH-adrenodoxin reductase [Ascosphaera aggregata]|nr:NADPH-adrenodoxin reductase [Ascosphaera aggregata]
MSLLSSSVLRVGYLRKAVKPSLPKPVVTLLRGGRRQRGYTNGANTTIRGVGPLRVAIVGAGPAGFYAASRLMTRVEDCYVDMYEKLPTPFGLVRYGVAPDHPEVKHCEEKFTEVAESPRFKFIGSVEIGSQLPLTALRDNYNVILFSYGAPYDRSSGIINSHLRGVHSARSFVGWYNGLPDHRDLDIDLSSSEDAVVIGNGNVALDVARILLSNVDDLRKTDIAEHAIEQLKSSRVKRVRVIGRRGLMQASFTIKEVRELIRLPGVTFQPIHPTEFPAPEILSSLSRAQKRMVVLLSGASQAVSAQSSAKSVSLEFLMQPIAFEDHPSNPSSRVHRTTFQSMQPDPATAHLKSGIVKPISYEDRSNGLSNAYHQIDVLKIKEYFETKRDIPFIGQNFPPRKTEDHDHKWTQGISIPSDLVFTSIGYTSAALPNSKADLSLPFDNDTGCFPNDGNGRILSEVQTGNLHIGAGPKPLRGLYCAGWVKNGPKGVIATTMTDAFMTAETIAKDWSTGSAGLTSRSGSGWEAVKREVDKLGLRATSWEDWKKIDKVEKKRGKEKGKIREKIVDVKEMLQLLD